MSTATRPNVETIQQHLGGFEVQLERLSATVETVHDAMKHLNQYETNRYADVLHRAIDDLFDLKLHAEYLKLNLEGQATAPMFNQDEYERTR